MNEIRYQYQPKLWLFLISTALTGFAVWVFWDAATTNDRGLIINGVIELATVDATIFYWACFCIMVLCTLMFIAAISVALGKKRFIILSGNGLTAPKNAFSGAYVNIPYASISGMQLQQTQHATVLKVVHQEGKWSVAHSMLPSMETFNELCEALAHRVAQHSGA